MAVIEVHEGDNVSVLEVSGQPAESLVITDSQPVTVVTEQSGTVVIEQLAGTQGVPGPANTLAIGTVQSGPSSSAEITGASPNQTLNLVLEKGDAATVAVGAVTTGLAGTSADVVNSGTTKDAILDFTIPRGDKGDKGDKGDTGTAATIAVGAVTTGAAGSPATVNNSGTSGAAVFDFSIPQGLKGDKGDAATIAVGAVSTGAPGSSVVINNVGTSGDAVFDFVIPRGDKGDTGNTGPANSLAVGTVTSVPNGTAPTVEITGAAPAQTINFSLEQGPRGDNVQWLSAPGAPSIAQGDIGDFYLNRTNGDVYEKTDASTWVMRANIVGPAGAGSIDTVNGHAGPDVTLTYLDVGAEPSGAVSSHEADTTNIHGIADTSTLVYTSDARLSDARTPLAHSHTIADVTNLQTTLNAKEGTIAAGTIGQYWRGDKSWQTLDKTAVGLANVDNTSDAAKPISTATQTALDGKANTVHTHTKSQITDFAHTHAIADLPVATSGTSSTTLLVRADDSRLSDARTPVAHVHAQADITGLTAALAGKEATIAAGTVSQYWRGDKTWQTLDKTTVGLANVDNTSDANKPVSTATQTALNAKENTIAAGTTAQYYRGDKTWQTLNAAAVANAVTTDTTQTITGAKTFSSALVVNASTDLNGFTRVTNTVANDASGTILVTRGGTDATLGPLDVAFGIHPSATGNNRYGFISVGDGLAMRNLALNTNGAGAFGRVGIGTTNPAEMLDVAGNITASGTVSAGGQLLVKTNDARLSDARTPSNDANLVHISGNETITGTKTFNQVSLLQTARTANLGSVAGDSVLVEQHLQMGAVNNYYRNTWMERRVAGSDWTTARQWNGISIDSSFNTPSTSKSWWMRSPQEDIQAWGSGSTTMLSISPSAAQFNVALYAQGQLVVKTNDSRLSDARTPLAHTHSASDITSGTIDQARLVVNIVRVVHNGTNYPARPTGATYVEWVGPTQPSAAVANDTWVNTA